MPKNRDSYQSLNVRYALLQEQLRNLRYVDMGNGLSSFRQYMGARKGLEDEITRVEERLRKLKKKDRV